MGKKLTPKQFLDKYGNACIIATAGTGIFPSVKLAQAALESGWGAKSLGNNLFGIKADKFWKGKVISFTTQEVLNGIRQTFKGTGLTYINRDEAIKEGANKYTLFREYNSLSDSIKDHSDFLVKNKRYSDALHSDTPEEQTQDLENAGYATTKQYNESLDFIINKYGFKILDKKKE